MTEPSIASLDRTTLDGFIAVLNELIQVIDQENALLAIPGESLPQELVHRKEVLGSNYARLTSALRPRTAALHAAGQLDIVAMEAGIRGLVRRLKDNQALLNARKTATALRVEAVMTAVAARERRDNLGYAANGDTRLRTSRSAGGLHLSA